MLARTLRKLIEDGTTTAREIGELAGVSTSTVYRWTNGDSRPDFDSVRLLVRLLPSPEGQEAILGAFINGTPWQVQHSQTNLDVNQDGQVDVEDALDAAIDIVRAAAHSLTRIRSAHQDSKFTAEDVIEVADLLNRVSRQCNITQQVLVYLAEERRKRKLKIAK